MNVKQLEERLDLLDHMIELLYQVTGCGTGGPLHIVVDDGNIEDHHLVWCWRNLHRRAPDSSPEFNLCKTILHELMMLSEAQRFLWQNRACTHFEITIHQILSAADAHLSSTDGLDGPMKHTIQWASGTTTEYV